jgi:hypothetical protein
MGQRPKDPNEAFAKRAKEVIDQALEQQGVVTQELLAKSHDNIGPGYETYAETLDKIGGASGTTFPRYVEGVKKEFGDVTNRFTKRGPAFGRGLYNFDPNLMGNESEKETSKYLMALGDMFSKEVEGLGKLGSKRLFALPEQARMAFTASSLSPASENLQNLAYMGLVQDPNVTQTNIQTTGKPFMTYNV